MPVDGLGCRLRGFRKSHHLIPAGPGIEPQSGIAVGSDASSQRAPACRVRINTIQKDKVETACPSSKALSIPGTTRSRWSRTSPPINNWAFERSGEDEVTIVSKGDWTDYQLSFTWMAEIEALHLACAFDMKIPPARRAEVQRLIAAINEQLWVGHFDIWTHTGMIMYRQALVLPGGLTASTAQCEAMLAGAIHACERYYPAFQFVVWAGKTAARGDERGDVRYRGRGVGLSLAARRPTSRCRPGANARDPYAVTSLCLHDCLLPSPRIN